MLFSSSLCSHCRALYQYVQQRYPDVNEEKEIKKILTNMVMVTGCIDQADGARKKPALENDQH